MSDPTSDLLERLNEIQRLHGAMALLGWDQEVTMPARGARTRAGQRAVLAGVIHERQTDPELGILLAELAEETDLGPGVAANVRESTRLRERALRVPASLVRELAEATALAQPDWVQARQDDDWSRFAPHLECIVRLKRAEAAQLDIGLEPYDSLLDEYEPGLLTREILPVFSSLRTSLGDLLGRLGAARPDPLPKADYPAGRQHALCNLVLDQMGFDFSAGRFDVSAHPFTEAIGRGDVRVTARFDEQDPLSSLSAAMHEGGHALYEQGLPEDLCDTPAGQAVSLGIHESQSQLWENHVGRDLPFCHWITPHLCEAFPEALSDLTAEQLYRSFNVVRRSPIRIEADEVTYNLHIILRLEIERALIAGDLEVKDVPAEWRRLAKDLLQITVKDDRTGPLQDIHWCMAGFGYFPTYTLGNLYAAMFWTAARQALPTLDEQLARGDFAPLKNWLRTNVHARGSILTAGELCREITGRELCADDFVAYLDDKFSALA